MPSETHTQVDSSSPLIPHTYPGRLIAAEGLDGSGKSTQLQLLQFWLQQEKRWNVSAISQSACIVNISRCNRRLV